MLHSYRLPSDRPYAKPTHFLTFSTFLSLAIPYTAISSILAESSATDAEVVHNILLPYQVQRQIAPHLTTSLPRRPRCPRPPMLALSTERRPWHLSDNHGTCALICSLLRYSEMEALTFGKNIGAGPHEVIVNAAMY